MPKCQWEIEKGSRKGESCGIYTKKENDGKFYCSSHLKMTESKAEPVTLKKTKTIKKIVKKLPKKEQSFDESESSKSSSDEDDFNEGKIVEEIKDKSIVVKTDKTLEEKIEEDFKKSLKEPKIKSKYVSREEFSRLKKKMNDLFFLFVKITGIGTKKTKDVSNDKEPELETFN